METGHAHIHVTGIVQGVGMRPFVYRKALEHDISGWVNNAGDGVHIEAHGTPGDIDAFVRALECDAPAAARIEHIEVRVCPATDRAPGFSIIASDGESERTTLVSPDIATCEDCLRELFDPADRRYHYPFINCTNCGPRFTIIRSLPYDRPATSMDRFPMCPACAAEYADPADRRFHAQPDACFACGPHITWRESGDAEPSVGTTRETSDAIIGRCADLLAHGRIVAIKGLGGFHLACNAADEASVRELRRRKRRSNKPLAVMMDRAHMDAFYRRCCVPNNQAIELLESSAHPIVLMRRRPGAHEPLIAEAVAGDMPDVGVMLPYTPLQHLLLAACDRHGVGALVMTSGNISEEPIEVDDARAWNHLVATGIADALLGNDRAILSRYDDSVMRVVDGTALSVRRARGYAPQPLPLPTLPHAGVRAPSVLACGPEQKSTLALTREEQDGGASCFVSQHIGDLENAAALEAWHEARERLETLFDLRPAALACDAHPGYQVSRWAREQAHRHGTPLIEVQHHHAHIASVIAEAASAGVHDLAEPVIGIAFDGTGAGADGTVWGGEFLVATLSGAQRAAHLRTWRLPGGAASIRDARRCAFSLLHALGLLEHPGAATLLRDLGEQERAVIATMIERGLNSPLTSSAGRLFDAAAALLGICGKATYEGEPACELEAAAWCAVAQGSPYEALHGPDRPAEKGGQGAYVVDTLPIIARILDRIAAGIPVDEIALAFHRDMAALILRTVYLIRKDTGITTVALSGGVFLNRLLLEDVTHLLRADGCTVLVPRTVPVNDGCIAYGQASVARARLAQAPR
ncbi:carbamoyltransferase HypF [Collinsella tanakaei]|uniref:carbamoyltransferase HypF n=1 Tax=Collinsella tanakaei TaxID=626935 RepID=UPI0025A42071|nr:carbamoyltransferase HypF [Collinsella tanakaei]MDM8300324.1 carbamoyltransferase HypF [Collinsella tanakaei]